ncbi:MAG: cation:proton antiporter, partial [Sulfurospirillaceae bacterium]|nr:cation:proton antiporter [Sulfurospirillaceae bacterium]
SLNTDEIFISAVFLLVIGSSVLAHVFGFSYSLGAFLAGMMMAETKFKYQIEADLVPFRDMLLGLFFVTVGMQINLNVIAEYYLEIAALLVAVMATKAVVIFSILWYFSGSRVALKASLAISQIGEFSLAIFALAHSDNLIDAKINQILIVTVVFSMIATPFILRNIKSIADFLIKSESEEKEFAIESAGIRDHIIVCGYGKLGQEIVYRLKKLNLPYLVLEYDINLVRLGKERNEPVFFGNATDKNILRKAYVENCRCIIVAMSNEKRLLLMCEVLASFDKKINTVVKVSDYEEKKLLKGLDVEHIVNEGRETAKAIIKEATSI